MLFYTKNPIASRKNEAYKRSVSSSSSGGDG
jgi:hypothetical protein